MNLLSDTSILIKQILRENLKAFLDDVIPTAEEGAGINYVFIRTILLSRFWDYHGLLVSLKIWNGFLKPIQSPNNGITFCAGSLSARKDNNLAEMIEKIGHRIHFVHLRNTQLTEDGSFYESGHLTGNQDMVAITTALLKEQKRRIKEGRKNVRMPFRPDHGLKILSDYNNKYNPGYPLIGRLKGLGRN